jgi:16S rRNA (guanine527-N7)-methyltransferase
VNALHPAAQRLGEEFNVSRESLLRLTAYVDLLMAWQTRINLIGASTVADIWTRHVADSLQLIRLFPSPLPRLADLGSGAGLPGLALAIARPLEAHLFESNQKKAAFLSEAVRLTAARATIHPQRIENAPSLVLDLGIEIVTARALAPLERLLEYGLPFLNAGATALFHKGQDVESELTAATKSWKVTVVKHQSLTDSRGCILEVREAHRV